MEKMKYTDTPEAIQAELMETAYQNACKALKAFRDAIIKGNYGEEGIETAETCLIEWRHEIVDDLKAVLNHMENEI